jgi:hypothetical protein
MISDKYSSIGLTYFVNKGNNKITEVAGRISDQLPSEGNASTFKDFAWGFVNIVAKALVKAGDKQSIIGRLSLWSSSSSIGDNNSDISPEVSLSTNGRNEATSLE